MIRILSSDPYPFYFKLNCVDTNILTHIIIFCRGITAYGRSAFRGSRTR